METKSFHSNQTSYPSGIKIAKYVEATVRNMYTKVVKVQASFP